MSAVPNILSPDIRPLRPILKWAGGKSQLIQEILPLVPHSYDKYIEPFFGGGAIFFAIQPDKSIISDSNSELINMYQIVANNVEQLIGYLKRFTYTEEAFYAVRELDCTKLSPIEAAARTIYLNKTCFNGLYRVNKAGRFNVPFGHYKNPKLFDEDTLYAASELLLRANIICGDYKSILQTHAKCNDFIFLDPPYLPISEYSDFKRYTKEQFYEEDHIELSKEIERLSDIGCNIILTNSNHPLVHELYNKYTIKVIQTNRNISCKGTSRRGEDVLIHIPPKRRLNIQLVPTSLPQQIKLFPSTRFMGSKNKLLSEIWSIASQFNIESVIDLFSGSSIVSYMFKAHGKKVISNDYMAMSTTFAKALIENNHITLNDDDVCLLLESGSHIDHFVETKFQGLYFSDDDNKLIDIIRSNIKLLKNPYKRSIAMSALIRACLKKRPRGIFTYIGNKYDDGRKDLSKSFLQQFTDAVCIYNNAVFSNDKKNKARNGDAMSLQKVSADLVYIDPPYYSPLSDNEYVRRYHFVEGLARYWEDVEIQEHTITKKFKSYPTPFSSRKGASNAFDTLFKRYRDSIIMVSYSSNSLPTMDEMLSRIAIYKKHVEVIPVKYKYSIGNQSHKVGDNKNTVNEYIFIGF